MTILDEARKLLISDGLLKILETYGAVLPTGSYALDLMTWRDLDLYLISEKISITEFFELGAAINMLLNPIKMSFRNEYIGKTKNLPKGLYWGIYLGNERKGAWKIDLWCLSEKEALERHKYCRVVESKLNPENRIVIHRLKQKCWKNRHYRKRFYSIDIYDAVLENGIASFGELKEYINSKYARQLID